MTEKRCIIACKVLWREINYLTSKSGYDYDVFYLEQGLHNHPPELKRKLQNKIDEIEDGYSHILIGYGLCSNGIQGVKSKKAGLVFVRAHDCITLFLGSKERYRKIFDENPGTYWYNTGWIETSNIPDENFYEKMISEYIEKYGREEAEYLASHDRKWIEEYKAAGYIEQGIVTEEKYKEFTRNAAKKMKWDYMEFKGDLNLLEDWINGIWNSERFLVLPPGKTIAPSYDEETIFEKTDSPDCVD